MMINYLIFKIRLVTKDMLMLCFKIMHVFVIMRILWPFIYLGRNMYSYGGITQAQFSSSLARFVCARSIDL